MGDIWTPERPVQIVAGTPPGGGLDRVARALSGHAEIERVITSAMGAGAAITSDRAGAP